MGRAPHLEEQCEQRHSERHEEDLTMFSMPESFGLSKYKKDIVIGLCCLNCCPNLKVAKQLAENFVATHLAN